MADPIYYVNNDLDITVETQDTGDTVDLTNATVKRIYYKKPVTKTVGYWSATLSGTHQLTYSADSDDIDEAGVWLIYAYVEFTTGLKYQGTVEQLEIRKEWQYR